MSDLHARLVDEIKRRVVDAQEQRKAMCDYITAGRQHESEREQELSAALRVAELHQKWAGKETRCHVDEEMWPCDTAKALLDTFVMDWRK